MEISKHDLELETDVPDFAPEPEDEPHPVYLPREQTAGPRMLLVAAVSALAIAAAILAMIVRLS